MSIRSTSVRVGWRFKAGRESVEDDERQSGMNHNIKRLHALVAVDRWLAIQMLSVKLDINKEIVCQSALSTLKATVTNVDCYHGRRKSGL
ncbi:hypothetical protein ILUMI_22524 [Ignelater luminosus]|uniref:Uncharacterized protein n=1 Tax=Ignelater luminosus TaxID=2038154 RepID=A0A8K0CE83_IGNLU|nr:hypothetical protein ILUMI_22524 [Ignelater luminosus]